MKKIVIQRTETRILKLPDHQMENLGLWQLTKDAETDYRCEREWPNYMVKQEWSEWRIIRIDNMISIKEIGHSVKQRFGAYVNRIMRNLKK